MVNQIVGCPVIPDITKLKKKGHKQRESKKAKWSTSVNLPWIKQTGGKGEVISTDELNILAHDRRAVAWS